MNSEARTRVLFSFSVEREVSNPFMTLLFASVEEAGVEAVSFSWMKALFSRYQVFHVHWPEYLVRDENAVRRMARYFLATLLVLRLFLCNIAVVRTRHNISPHSRGTKFESWFSAALERLAVVDIAMNNLTEPSPGIVMEYIPHGHYLPVLPPQDGRRSVGSGTLLLFGALRGNKGVADLVDAVVCGGAGSDLDLRVVGDPVDRLTRSLVEQGTKDSAHVHALLRRLSDEEIVEEILGAEMVVLPYPRLFNSGALILALSLSTPVLVPASAVASELQDEFGEFWVATYSGDLRFDILKNAVEASRRSLPEGSCPDLSARDWDLIGNSHRRAYRRAVSIVSNRH